LFIDKSSKHFSRFGFCMQNDSISSKALSPFQRIHTPAAQLTQWDTLQEKQRLRRLASKGTSKECLAIARFQARHSFLSQPDDPLCEHFESPFHSTGSCHVQEVLESLEREDQETSFVQVPSVQVSLSVGIHLAILHRVQTI
jgi:hypothetical protein